MREQRDLFRAETTWFHVFHSMIETGDIARMGPYAVTDCPTYMLSHRVADELDEARRKILATFRSVHASFGVSLR